jgi:hypothetical protein
MPRKSLSEGKSQHREAQRQDEAQQQQRAAQQQAESLTNTTDSPTALGPVVPVARATVRAEAWPLCASARGREGLEDSRVGRFDESMDRRTELSSYVTPQHSSTH